MSLYILLTFKITGDKVTSSLSNHPIRFWTLTEWVSTGISERVSTGIRKPFYILLPLKLLFSWNHQENQKKSVLIRDICGTKRKSAPACRIQWVCHHLFRSCDRNLSNIANIKLHSVSGHTYSSKDMLFSRNHQEN